MKRRIVLWGFVGIIIAGCWVVLSWAIAISTEPILWSLARLTCPIVPISMLFRADVLSQIEIYADK